MFCWKTHHLLLNPTSWFLHEVACSLAMCKAFLFHFFFNFRGPQYLPIRSNHPLYVSGSQFFVHIVNPNLVKNVPKTWLNSIPTELFLMCNSNIAQYIRTVTPQPDCPFVQQPLSQQTYDDVCWYSRMCACSQKHGMVSDRQTSQMPGVHCTFPKMAVYMTVEYRMAISCNFSPTWQTKLLINIDLPTSWLLSDSMVSQKALTCRWIVFWDAGLKTGALEAVAPGNRLRSTKKNEKHHP